jgi:TolB-like protein/DNA-binding winged helix-turn-helix (wHTH) protein/Flp pilus assembly protein TadD
MDTLASDDIFLFESFRLHRRSGGLFRRDGHGVFVPMAIGSRALGVLGVLVERQGDIVSRDAIIAAVWPSTVVEDNNLNVQIAALRRVLDDRRSEGSCIQTVPGYGYRFVAMVRRVDPAPLTSGSNFSTGSDGPVAGTVQPRGSGSPDGLGNIPTVRISRALPRTWRGAGATITGTAVLLAAVLAAWIWHSLRPSEPHPAPRLSIVALPFANLSDDKEQQYFADGITEDLTTDLSRIEGSFVISRNTAFTYKDKPIDAKQIGRELGVRYVLEGSVQRSSNQVRVNAQLIDAETDGHVWAERFEHDIGDLFALQSDVTGRIAAALNLELVSAEAARPTDHPEVLDYIFRGRSASNRGPSREGFAEAISDFEHALALDPGSVEAQSSLANELSSRVMNQLADAPAADLERADGLIAQAMATSPRNRLAHSAKAGWLKAQGRCEEAIPEYEFLIALNPNSVSWLANLGQCKIFTGSIDEGIALEKKVLHLSPRDPFNGNRYWAIGFAHLLQSHTDEAIVWLEKGRDLSPKVPYTHARLAAAYALIGQNEQAASELAEARRLSPDDRYSSIARLKAAPYFVLTPKVRALYESTYIAGLRKAGMPEE